MTGPAAGAIDERVAVNGVELFTRTVGLGPDVLVLHGGPAAHHDYLLPQFDKLAVGRRLRYYDQRGGGRSPVGRAGPLGWQEHVADHRALITKWGLEPATLLGYSWGGLLALLFATEHPTHIGRLALVSPAPSYAAAQRDYERRLAARMARPEITHARRELRASDLRARDPAAYRQRAFELAVAGYFRDPSQARSLTPFRITDRTYRAVWASLAGFDLRDRLAGLGVPALVVHGRDDPIPLSTAQETANLIGARLTVLEDCGHVPHVENLQAFVAALDEFLPSAR